MSIKNLVMVAALASGVVAGPAFATVNLVQNGSFEDNAGVGQINGNTSVSSWTVTPAGAANSYAFVFSNSTDTTSGSPQNSAWPYTPVILDSATAPTTAGSYFIGIDPAYRGGTISQNITGLTAGATYAVTFSYEATQQSLPNPGATTAGFTVGFGAASQATPTLNVAAGSASGWKTATMIFTASGTSDLLSFAATGGPSVAVPPFALLDNVSVTAAPEASTWAMMMLGFAGLGLAGYRSRKTKRVAA